MSQENVDLHLRAVDAFNRGDLPTLLAVMDDDVRVEARVIAMEGTYTGHDGVRRWWQDLHDAFPDWTVEATGVRVFGDHTVATLRAGGHGAESGVPVEVNLWQVVEMRDGKAIRLSSHDTEAEALDAAGLLE